MWNNYIPAITSTTKSNDPARNSTALIRNPGQTPIQASMTDGTANVISKDVMGNDRRLVIRKFIGNVLKWYQAAGAVKT